METPECITPETKKKEFTYYTITHTNKYQPTAWKAKHPEIRRNIRKSRHELNTTIVEIKMSCDISTLLQNQHHNCDYSLIISRHRSKV